ncbi:MULTISPECIES: DUF4922 domain-containing protein [Alistipes]|uniref:DUF4922 domain-containing protein n=1 Tax=Alistipes hominis TaxID=2763015 RepID=A0ABR7CNW3_9BACT|nr:MULTISPECIES: DUF4922 domain-containing protein [Alistipes]MDO5385152.1 DUF4922 domain-containing protein [Rikenellaceae bacterium]MBC5617330.1 DUF4922 domain-containing protein [Alistipes hominis]MBS1414545.1 DUF4922 domain-containing protein [Alistipes sp.]RHO72004.1 DUF4922 domain-containing protein [Alistipes sp. AF48-12]RHR61547.1 DUF4922 domain-containing protein [Alistipes sp. AF17-16]
MNCPGADELNAFFESQLAEWEFARRNFEALRRIETKTFDLDGFLIRVQFNPARIVSSAAKVDAASVVARKCFLCSENQPPEQRGLPWGDGYRVLVNPYPIFARHFTIPAAEHVPQSIADRYGDMLALARCFDREVVFYNGPRCGASAPDHAHFQAVGKGAMPLEAEVGRFATEKVLEASGAAAYAIRDYLRGGFVIRSADASAAAACFGKLYEALEVLPADAEPMMNVLTWYDSDGWTSCVFPRTKHRPACFYGEGATDLLVSPASVDLAGVMIVPRKDDFVKITAENIRAIFNEVCIDDSALQRIVGKLNIG